MDTAEIFQTIERCEKQIQELSEQRRALRKKALELNAERDKAAAQLDLARLRDKHPDLKIEPK